MKNYFQYNEIKPNKRISESDTPKLVRIASHQDLQMDFNQKKKNAFIASIIKDGYDPTLVTDWIEKHEVVDNEIETFKS